ncbi:MAG: RNA polymerase sigma factor [Microgenomates group bacterium]
MTDTTTLEANAMSVQPDLQDNIHTDPDNTLNKIPETPSTPGNKDAQIRVPTWSAQITALRDDFIRGENTTAFFNLVSQEMRSYFTSNNQTPQDTEDLTQEVLVKLHLLQKRFSGNNTADGLEASPTYLPAFIRRMAHNVLVDKFRKQRATFIDSEREIPDDEEPFLERLPDTSISTDEYVETQLKADQLKDILPALTDRQQHLLTLMLEGQTNMEIAASLSMNTNAVNKALFDLRKRMRTLLTPHENHQK